jgi:recombinational DNA repair ATPase RecF
MARPATASSMESPLLLLDELLVELPLDHRLGRFWPL